MIKLKKTDYFYRKNKGIIGASLAGFMFTCNFGKVFEGLFPDTRNLNFHGNFTSQTY